MSGNKRADRYYQLKGKKDQRRPFERDRDRILYSREFRRLSGVTQVARTQEAYLFHDRMSHSLKVAQVGNRLAQYLLDEHDLEDHLDPDVVETACMAHDLGHPPFGHAVEQQLDELMEDDGGFEANPQSFRIVTKLAAHRKEYTGLNLTRASLNAMLKYPWKRGEDGNYNKWGYFESETDVFDFARQISSKNQEKCLEAQVMDWADDLTYAIHDVNDFYRAGLIPLDRILEKGSEEQKRFIDYFYTNTDTSAGEFDAKEFLEHIKNISDPELDTPYTGTQPEDEALYKLTSSLVQYYMGIDTDVMEIEFYSDFAELQIEEKKQDEINLLKHLVKFFVINDSTLMAQQHGQRKIIEELFNILIKQVDSSSEYKNIIPSPHRERLDALDEGIEDEPRKRIICDLIASMTERQTVLLYERLIGRTPGSLLNEIVR